MGIHLPYYEKLEEMPKLKGKVKEVYDKLGPFDYDKYAGEESFFKEYQKCPIAGPYLINHEQAVYHGSWLDC